MTGKKSMRVMLVNQTYQSYLIAYSGGNYYVASNLLKALSRLVGVKIPGIPFREPNLMILVNQAPFEQYCSRHLDATMIGVDKFLKKHAHAGSVKLWTKNDEDDSDEEDEE